MNLTKALRLTQRRGSREGNEQRLNKVQPHFDAGLLDFCSMNQWKTNYLICNSVISGLFMLLLSFGYWVPEVGLNRQVSIEGPGRVKVHGTRRIVSNADNSRHL